MKLNTEPWNYYGPMAYNQEMKSYIEKNGKKPSELEFVADEKYPKHSEAVNILHVPSGKVNGYEVYFEKSGRMRAFNGLGMPPVDCDLDEFLVVYTTDKFEKEEAKE